MPFLAIPFPAIDPVLVHLGPFAIRWYALAYIVAIVCGWLVLRRLVQRPGWVVDVPAIDDAILYVTLGIILGGRIGYVLFYNGPWYLSHPLDALQVWRGGMSFHGGLIGVIIALTLFARSRKLPVLEFGDLAAAVAPIGLLLGRIANFINGELWGRPTDVPWAMVFPGAGPLPRHPSQLYEAFLEGIVLLIVMQVLAWRPRRPEQRGRLGGVFLIGYALARIAVEFFREPDAQLGYLAGGITMGQLLSCRCCWPASCCWPGRFRRGPDGDALSQLAAARSRRVIRERGPASIVGRYMALAPGPPAARLLHEPRPLGRRRRLRHRPRDQPDVRRAARASACVAVLARRRPPRPGPAGRARARPRHADGRRAARRRASCPSSSRPRSCTWSRPAPSCAPARPSCSTSYNPHWHATLADRPDVGAAAPRRQRVLRRPADPPVRPQQGPLARAARRPRRGRRLRLRALAGRHAAPAPRRRRAARGGGARGLARPRGAGPGARPPPRRAGRPGARHRLRRAPSLARPTRSRPRATTPLSTRSRPPARPT